jgi:hypothetical protein
MITLAPYLYATALAWSPLSAHDYTRVDRAVTDARYHSIAEDLERVVLDPREAPLFDGPTARAQTAVLMLAIASFESGGFRADVDRQDEASGDGGAAWCLAQLHLPYAKGLTDRASCFRGMLHALHDSWDMCATDGWDPAYHITGYTVGHCEANEPEALHRAGRAMKWWAASPWLAPVDPEGLPAAAGEELATLP